METKAENKEKMAFDLEKGLIENGYSFVIGIDEAGRGPLAGPVVASACIFKKICHAEFISASQENQIEILKQVQNDKNISIIRDSKLLSEKQREEIFDFIFENFYVGLGICDHETIDRINILEATYLAMKKSVSALNDKLQITNDKKIILVDGNKMIPNMSIEQRAIVGGDKIVKSISAASIVAKVTRDRMMHSWHEKYPQYGFSKHKGYGTKFHIDAIKKYGPCEIHRKSFAPVKKAIDVMNNIF